MPFLTELCTDAVTARASDPERRSQTLRKDVANASERHRKDVANVSERHRKGVANDSERHRNDFGPISAPMSGPLRNVH